MLGYVLRRLLWLVPVLFFIATITFFLMHRVPGGPFTSDKARPPAVEEALRRKYGLDKPLWVQYRTYMWNLLHGDLGISTRQGDRPVTQIISRGFSITLQLGVLALIVSVAVGLTLGTIAALNRNGPMDYLSVVFATIGASMPNFVLAVFLIIIFAVNLHWFDIIGWGEPWFTLNLGLFDLNIGGDPRKMVLPIISLSALPAAYIARITRASMLEVMGQDYVRTGRAKGLQERTLVTRHVLKNGMIPVLTLIGPISANLITGSFITESIYSIPGIGRSFVQSVFDRDYGLIMGTTLFYAFVVVLANLIVDILYAVVDPRIKYS
jgi:oligopeptide transport system permease protein